MIVNISYYMYMYRFQKQKMKKVWKRKMKKN